MTPKLRSLKHAFWSFAHRRYQLRSPRKTWDYLAGGWVVFWSLIYSASLATDFHWRDVLVGALVIVPPLIFVLGHSRIGNVKQVGPDALYRKRLQYGPKNQSSAQP